MHLFVELTSSHYFNSTSASPPPVAQQRDRFVPVVLGLHSRKQRNNTCVCSNLRDDPVSISKPGIGLANQQASFILDLSLYLLRHPVSQGGAATFASSIHILLVNRTHQIVHISRHNVYKTAVTCCLRRKYTLWYDGIANLSSHTVTDTFVLLKVFPRRKSPRYSAVSERSSGSD
jgi:hypothetical protein